MSTDRLPAADATLEVLGTAEYVALTTFRGSGVPVTTPVWTARRGNGVMFYTPSRSRKGLRSPTAPLTAGWPHRPDYPSEVNHSRPTPTRRPSQPHCGSDTASVIR